LRNSDSGLKPASGVVWHRIASHRLVVHVGWLHVVLTWTRILAVPLAGACLSTTPPWCSK
jgi:hypothetical protein